MIHKEKSVFQVIEIVSSNNPVVLKGLVMGTIQLDDELSLLSPDTNPYILGVKEIALYGKTVDEITRGMTAKITFHSESEVSFGDERFLYLQMS